MKMFLATVRTDGGTQPRTSLDEAIVAEYADAIKEGAEFPEVDVFHDGIDFWLADGFHRYFAYKQAGKDSIPAKIHEGTKRDAILFSVAANAIHGLRRSNDDKRKAVTTLLQDPEWAQWSDRKIALVCRVGRDLVGDVRSHLSVPTDGGVRKVERCGTIYHQNTTGQAAAGKAKKGKKGGGKSGAKNTKTEPDQPVRDELEDAVQTLTEANRELTAEVETLRASSNGGAEKTIRELKAYIKVVESQRDEWMNKCGELTKEVRRLQRRLGVKA